MLWSALVVVAAVASTTEAFSMPGASTTTRVRLPHGVCSLHAQAVCSPALSRRGAVAAAFAASVLRLPLRSDAKAKKGDGVTALSGIKTFWIVGCELTPGPGELLIVVNRHYLCESACFGMPTRRGSS